MKNEQIIRSWQIMKIRGVKAIVFGWFWHVDVFGRYELILELLYWKYIVWIVDRPASKLSAVRAFGFWSGFMSEARGKSWDRKSRYGIK